HEINFSSGILWKRDGTVKLSLGSGFLEAASPDIIRMQFLPAAFASYIAVSAQAISCCGERAWSGKTAMPKLADNEKSNRRPPLNRCCSIFARMRSATRQAL